MIHSIRTLAILLTLFTSCHAFAQDKVVVVPLFKSTLTEAAFDGANGSVELTSANAVIRTVVINVPRAGVIIANASGYMDLNNNTDSYARCSITKDGSYWDSSAAIISGGHTSQNRFIPFGATRGFTVTEAGEVTISLVCNEYSGVTDITDTNLTAMFFPN